MEGMIGEIRLFAGNFAPKNWAFCQGQIINIAQNTALFSILGTVYGGNGTTTFGLPNLSGRVAIGQGTGPGLDPVVLGQVGGAVSVALTSNELPLHTHQVVRAGNPTTNVSSANATQSAATAGASIAAPGTLSGRTFTPTLGFVSSAPDTTLAAGSVSIAGMSFTNAPSGGSQPHENRQPYLGMNYVVCMYGIFPARN